MRQETGVVQTVAYSDDREGYLCVPRGEGPFGVAVYNHGGLGSVVGGDPSATCLALMDAGWLGFAPMRRSTTSIEGHADDMNAGIAYALAHEQADVERLAVLGFSRGGYLMFSALTGHDGIALGVLMAPASVGGRLESLFGGADRVEASTLILVAENDLPEFNNENMDHVATSTGAHEALEAAGKSSELVILDAWEDNGHDLFQEVRDVYWDLVVDHLDHDSIR